MTDSDDITAVSRRWPLGWRDSPVPTPGDGELVAPGSRLACFPVWFLASCFSSSKSFPVKRDGDAVCAHGTRHARALTFTQETRPRPPRCWPFPPKADSRQVLLSSSWQSL